MKSKILKAYKFSYSIIFGILAGSLLIFLLTLYDNWMAFKSGESVDPFSDLSTFLLFYFPFIICSSMRAKKPFMISNGISRRSIYFSQLLTIGSSLPLIAVLCIITEKVYMKTNGYVLFVEQVYNNYFSERSVSDWGLILFNVLWLIGNIVLLFGIVMTIIEINPHLSKIGKIIFFCCLGVGVIVLIISLLLLLRTNNEFLGNVLGFGKNPVHSTISKLIISIPIYIAYYLFARRSPIQTK